MQKNLPVTIDGFPGFSTPRSSQIAFIGYDATNKVLRVEFKSGGKYNYSAVPFDVWENFRHAGSQGAFFAREIRGRYAHRNMKEAANG